MTNKSHQLIDLIDHFDNAMLVTAAVDGDIHARPMAIAKCTDKGDLYFATDRQSGKIDEIEKHPRVAVTLQGGKRYASLSGRAEVVDNHALVEELWSEAWKVWFPEGKNDPRLVLLKVSAGQGEYWDMSGTNRIEYLIEAGAAYLKGERLDQDDPDRHGNTRL